MDLAQLQNAAKKDPESYKDDCLMQYRHFNNELEIFKLKPNTFSKKFVDQVSFFSHIAGCYPKELGEFPKQLMELMEEKYMVLDPEMRKHLVKALFLLRNRNFYTPLGLLPLLFKLFRCHDKQLRSLIFNFIVQDIRSANKKKKDNHLNKSLQNFMFTMLQDESTIAARKSLDVMIELYNKNIWDDAKTVNVISGACFLKDSKMLVAALQFFLKGRRTNEDEDEEDAAATKARQARDAYQKYSNPHAKKTKKRMTKMKKALNAISKSMKKKDDQDRNFNFSAVQLINDPQGFSEKLFGVLKHSLEKFEVRMLIMNLISRVIASHKVILLNFYPFLQKYMQPHQNHVTYILSICAQSIHDLVPDDVISPIIKTIANNFVNDRTAPEVITIGLNAIREICSRSGTLGMEKDLLKDLISYKTYKNKGVGMAAKSLLTLFRSMNPSLLPKKDRGKLLGNREAPKYGEYKPAEMVDGVDLLEEDELNSNKTEDIMDGWYSDGSDGEWVTVSHSDNSENEDGPSAENNNWDDIWSTDEEDESAYDEGEDEGEGEEEDAEEAEEEEEEESNGETSEPDQEAILSDGGSKRKRDSSDNEQSDSKRFKQSTLEETPIDNEDTKPSEEKKSLRIDALRILGPEDFERIAYLKLRAAVDGSNQRFKNKKVKFNNSAPSNQEIVTPEDIESGISKRRMSKEERLASVAEGREGREKFGRQKKELGSKTNKEKQKKLPFALKKHSRKYREKKSQALHHKRKAISKHLKHSKSYSAKKK